MRFGRSLMLDVSVPPVPRQRGPRESLTPGKLLGFYEAMLAFWGVDLHCFWGAARFVRAGLFQCVVVGLFFSFIMVAVVMGGLLGSVV